MNQPEQIRRLKTVLHWGRSVAVAALVVASTQAAAAQIAIGHLVDYSGPTADVVPYGQGVSDALAWINKRGGLNGQMLNVDTVDYGYQVPRALAQ